MHHRVRGQTARPYRRLRCEHSCRPQGAAPGRSVHRLWHRRRRPGDRRCGAGRCARERPAAYGLFDRFGDRRTAGHRKRVEGARRKGAEPRLAALRPRAADQPHLGASQHQIRIDGPQPRGRHRMRDRRAFDRRRRAHDHDGRRRRHAGGRCGRRDLPDRDRGLCTGARAVDGVQRHARKGIASV